MLTLPHKPRIRTPNTQNHVEIFKIQKNRFLNFLFLKVGIETSVWGVGARLPPPAIPALSGERSPDPQILTFEIKNSNLSFPKICKLCDRWSQHESFSCPTTAQAGSGRTSPITTWGQKSVWRSIFENDFPLKLMFFLFSEAEFLKLMVASRVQNTKLTPSRYRGTPDLSKTFFRL